MRQIKSNSHLRWIKNYVKSIWVNLHRRIRLFKSVNVIEAIQNETNSYPYGRNSAVETKMNPHEKEQNDVKDVSILEEEAEKTKQEQTNAKYVSILEQETEPKVRREYGGTEEALVRVKLGQKPGKIGNSNPMVLGCSSQRKHLDWA